MAKPTLNIAFRNQYPSFYRGKFVDIIRHLSPVPLVFTSEPKAHMIIIGPYPRRQPLYRRVIRKANLAFNKVPKVTVYCSGENTRHNAVEARYSITSDLCVGLPTHFRAPNWWFSLDWSGFGVTSSKERRIRNQIPPEKLLQPLGKQVLERPRRAALITTHLNEPRRSLFEQLQQVIPIDGYGRHFDRSIRDHNSSGFYKDDLLQNYAFSLCPENSMYPGYYTEKVPESYAAGCIPITWADQNITVDFQPGSFINLADHVQKGYSEAFLELTSPEQLDRLCSTPLLKQLPDFQGLLHFMEKIVHEALS